jgi:AmiR/NasT family two-component response regulator
VVVLTASLSPDDAHRARTAGAAGYLTKGCAAEHVVGALLEVGTCVFDGADKTEREAAALQQVAQA